MRRLRVLDVTEFYSETGGGVRTYLHAKCRWAGRHPDVAHAIAVPSHRHRVEVRERSRVYHLPGPRAPASPGYHLLVAARALREVVERERPDIIEIGSPYAAPWLLRGAAARSGARLVAFHHADVMGMATNHLARWAPAYARRWMLAPIRRYLRAAYQPCAAVVAAARAVEAGLRGIGIHPVHLVPLAADADLFHPDRRSAAWRAGVGASPTEPVALSVGRLSFERGLGALLQALPELHRVARLRLVLIGEGHLRERLEAHADVCPEMLTVLPYQRDRTRLAEAYASADLYLAPSALETFGLATLEAMASGLPIVGPDAGALRDLVGAAPWGRLFRPGDANDLVRAVKEVLALDGPTASQQARAAATPYGWDRTWERLFGIYEAVLSQDRPKRSSRPPAAAPSTSV
jgi:alpha-1,6-mannosyltransferase